MKKLAIQLFIFLISFSTFGQNFYQNDNSLIKLDDGQSIITTKNQSFEKGKVHLITYVMILSSCPPCIQEIINLNKYFKDLKETLSFDYSVIFDSPPSRLDRTISDASSRMKYYLKDFPIYFDENANQIGLPNTIIIDKNGEVVYSLTGLKDDQRIKKIHDKLIELNTNKINENIKSLKEEKNKKKDLGITLTIPYSKSNEYLSNDIKEKIDKLIPVFNQYRDTEFKIEVYADNNLKNESSKDFSQNRANELKKYLIFKKIPEERVAESIGLGEKIYQDKNDKYDEKMKKNMIVFTIYPAIIFSVTELENLTKDNIKEFDDFVVANNFNLDETTNDHVSYSFDTTREVRIIQKSTIKTSLRYTFGSLYAFNDYKSELINLGYNYLGIKTNESGDFEVYENKNFSFKFLIFKRSDGKNQYTVLVNYYNN